MLEQIYQDITANVLPKISEGLMITKDYFTDLFGRYVKFLIITDTIYLLFWFSFIWVCVSVLKKVLKIDFQMADDKTVVFGILGGIFGSVLFFLSIGLSFYYGTNLAKDLTIPEVRVWEEIKLLK